MPPPADELVRHRPCLASIKTIPDSVSTGSKPRPHQRIGAVPGQRSQASLGLLNLSKRYGDARLEAACTLALSLGTCKYTHIRDMLLNRRDLLQASAAAEAPDWTSPSHAHVRGPGYYQ